MTFKCCLSEFKYQPVQIKHQMLYGRRNDNADTVVFANKCGRAWQVLETRPVQPKRRYKR